ncbi:cytosine-purine permease [Mycena floridula]|nr:cytosine-purine permease [Mycena floridula]
MPILAVLRAIDDRIRLEPGEKENSTRWSNHDLKPVPKHLRTWNAWDFVTYWTSDQFAPGNWSLGSSLVLLGLTARQAIPITFFGFFIMGFVICLQSRAGAVYHVPFPVLNRSVYGMYGSYFPIAARSMLSLMWLSILTFGAGNITGIMIGAIWPSFNHLHNSLPLSANITSRQLISLFIFWIIQTPLSLIPISKIKWLFAFKAVLVPPTFIAIAIWGIVMSHGGGDIVQKKSMVTGNFGWAIVTGLNIITGFYSTLSVNVPDFSRYAKRPASTWSQLVAIPVTGTVPVACAYMTTSACLQLYGVETWDPASVIALWDSRAAQFFAGFSFLVATVSVNISANSVSFATDMMALCPRYVNLFRGGILAAVLAIAITPWNIVASAPAFYKFLGAYAVWLGPIVGVSVVDFYLIKKQKLDIRELYKGHGIYSYTWGMNWRAYTAFLCGFMPNFPGFINAINPNIPNGNPVTYHFAWLFGFTTAFTVHYLLSTIFPPKTALIEEAVYPDDLDTASPAETGSIEDVKEKEDAHVSYSTA